MSTRRILAMVPGTYGVAFLACTFLATATMPVGGESWAFPWGWVAIWAGILTAVTGAVALAWWAYNAPKECPHHTYVDADTFAKMLED